MSEDLPVWQSAALPQETPQDAASRYVFESFGVDRLIVWGGEEDGPGVFWFVDGYWRYRITFGGGSWTVHRLGTLSPAGKARRAARLESREQQR